MSTDLPYSTQPLQPGPPPRTSGTAIAALIVAIGSYFVCPLIGAIIALVLASSAARELDQYPGQLPGHEFAGDDRARPGRSGGRELLRRDQRARLPDRLGAAWRQQARTDLPAVRRRLRTHRRRRACRHGRERRHRHRRAGRNPRRRARPHLPGHLYRPGRADRPGEHPPGQLGDSTPVTVGRILVIVAASTRPLTLVTARRYRWATGRALVMRSCCVIVGWPRARWRPGVRRPPTAASAGTVGPRRGARRRSGRGSRTGPARAGARRTRRRRP